MSKANADPNPYITVIEDDKDKAQAHLDAIDDYCRGNLLSIAQDGFEREYDPLPEFMVFLQKKTRYDICKEDTVILIFCEMALVNGISMQFPRGNKEEIREFINNFTTKNYLAIDFAIHLSTWERYRLFLEDYSEMNH